MLQLPRFFLISPDRLGAALLPHPPLVRPNHSVFSGPADYRPGNHASREKQPVILAARRCIDYFSSYVSALRAVAA